MKVVAIIQARMGSERLPGKVLKLLHGHSILKWVVSRVRQSRVINQVVLATTTSSKDDNIVEVCHELGVDVYRGAEQDVLGRFYDAAVFYKADVIVRICSDCPLIDVTVIDAMLESYISINKTTRLDYLSNTLNRTFPRGLDVEIFSFDVLKVTFEQANKPSEREHVTPFIYHNPQTFKIEQYATSTSHADLRWTLDTEEDFAFLQSLLEMCQNTDKLNVTTADLIACLENNPSLIEINAHIRQKELTNV
jgi:spore coat polysaccharide biosynthesis protein SpsF